MMNNETSENPEINFNNRIPLEDLQIAVTDLKSQLAKVIIGQENFIELLITAF
ncbi:MAG: magnesium chelatase, partial [Gillisia sp.]|nr:magnesium chelatase [Gillisia sp.]